MIKKFLLKIIDKETLKNDVLFEIRKKEQEKAESRNYKELAKLKKESIEQNNILEDKLKKHFRKRLSKMDKKYRKEINFLRDEIKKKDLYIKDMNSTHLRVVELESMLHAISEEIYVEAQAEKFRQAAYFQRKGKHLNSLEHYERKLEGLGKKILKIKDKHEVVT